MYNNKELIANIAEANPILSICICKICGGVIIDAVQCEKCDNCFCKKCISKITECPYQCGDIKVRPSKLMNKILNNLKFKCLNDCEAIIPYKELFSHYLLSCEKINFKDKYKELESEYEKAKIKNQLLKMKNSQLLAKLNVNNISIDKMENFYISQYHMHPLLKDDVTREEAICDVCGRSIFPPVYSFYCSSCDFDYCNLCANSEKKEENSN